MPICPICGRSTPEGKFCESCGAALIVPSVQITPPTSPTPVPKGRYIGVIVLFFIVLCFIGYLVVNTNHFSSSIGQSTYTVQATPVQIMTASMPTSIPTGSFDVAGALYSKSVDLANAGKYTEALQTADQALALNVNSLTPIIQANRAGILVMLGRNEEAIAAADVSLAAQGNLTTTHAIAWYNKGNALRALGRTTEARAAYAQATALDPTLTNPYQT